jgi:hypothetical protein
VYSDWLVEACLAARDVFLLEASTDRLEEHMWVGWLANLTVIIILFLLIADIIIILYLLLIQNIHLFDDD